MRVHHRAADEEQRARRGAQLGLDGLEVVDLRIERLCVREATRLEQRDLGVNVRGEVAEREERVALVTLVAAQPTAFARLDSRGILAGFFRP